MPEDRRTPCNVTTNAKELDAKAYSGTEVSDCEMKEWK
jgi:hypothetical protein